MASAPRSKPHDAAGEGVHEGVEFAVGHRAVDPAVELGGVGVVVLAADRDFQCPGAADQARQPVEAAAAGHHARADLGLPEQGALAAGEPDVAGQRELVPDAPGAAADGRDADDARMGQAVDEVVPVGGQVGRSGHVGHLGHPDDVEVGDEVVRVGAVEHDDADLRVRLQVIEQHPQRCEGLRVEEVDRRVLEGHTPVAGRDLVDAENGLGGSGSHGEAPSVLDGGPGTRAG